MQVDFSHSLRTSFVWRALLQTQVNCQDYSQLASENTSTKPRREEPN